MPKPTIALFAALVLTLPATLRAADWPQWMGPERDGAWREQGLLDAIPAGGLKVRWRAPVGMGYGGPAVAGGKVFVMDRTLKAGSANPADPFAQQGRQRRDPDRAGLVVGRHLRQRQRDQGVEEQARLGG